MALGIEKRMRQWVKWLISMPVNIFLLLILATLSALGTLIEQNQETAFYEGVYGPAWTVLIQALGLQDVFHSKLFIALAVTVTATLCACTLTRVQAVWQQMNTFGFCYREADYHDCHHKGMANSSKQPKEMAYLLHSAFLKKKYRVFSEERENRYYLYADRGRFGFLGSLFIHFSLVIILVGAFYGGVTGYRDQVLLYEGDTLGIKGPDFSVKLNNIQVDYYDNGMTKQYYSHLEIQQVGQGATKKVVSVNHPLTHQGVTFYQADYGWAIDGIVKIQGKQDSFVTWRGGSTQSISGYDVKADFYPDYAETKGGSVETGSPYPHNSHVVYIIYQGDRVIAQGVSKMNTPVIIGDGALLTFTQYREYSVFILSRDPSLPIVFSGLALMVLGLCLNFFWFPRKIWAMVIPENSGSRVLLCGFTARYQSLLDKEIGVLAEEALQPLSPFQGKGMFVD